MDPSKKISFGFNKLSKKTFTSVHNKPPPPKVELVDCLEGQAIKIRDAVEVVDEPLVIPIIDNKRNLLDRVKEAKAKQKELIKKEVKVEEGDTRPDSELTLDELAARELINEAKNRLLNKAASNKLFVLPLKEEQLPLEGEKEPTLNDYENVPISDYGLAMLRGMGWKEGMGIGKNVTKTVAVTAPELRPKGLGLGATKMVNAEMPTGTACDKDGKALILKRGTCAKIIAGSHKGNYCEVQGLDDEAGRVIVRTSLTGEILTLNEFLIVPVTKEEYSKGAKVLNNAKYEEYKEISDKKLEDYRLGNSKGTIKVERSDEEDVKGSSSSKKNSRMPSDEHSRRRTSSNSDETADRYSRKANGGEKSRENRTRPKDKERDRSSSSSESISERKRKKDKKKKKDRHRERSKSNERKHKSEKKSAKLRHRSRSSSEYDDKERHRKTKSKSRHRRRSSSESDREYRKNRR